MTWLRATVLQGVGAVGVFGEALDAAILILLAFGRVDTLIFTRKGEQPQGKRGKLHTALVGMS